MQRYKVYGICIASDIELPELLLSDNEVTDAVIIEGPVPKDLPCITSQGAFYQASFNDFLLRVDRIGAIRVQNGDTIIVERDSFCSPEEFRIYILGSGLGALLHQKGIFAIHGSAIETDKGGLIISGVSSSGKSTLAASLVKMGFKAISDDIAAIHLRNNKLLLHHGIPSLKLWGNVVKALSIKEDLIKVANSLDKFRMPLQNNFRQEPIKIFRIISLSTKNSDGFEIEELNGIEKFHSLRNNTYRLQYIDGLQVTKHHFENIGVVANKIELLRIRRPISPVLINELANFVVKEIVMK